MAISDSLTVIQNTLKRIRIGVSYPFKKMGSLLKRLINWIRPETFKEDMPSSVDSDFIENSHSPLSTPSPSFISPKPDVQPDLAKPLSMLPSKESIPPKSVEKSSQKDSSIEASSSNTLAFSNKPVLPVSNEAPVRIVVTPPSFGAQSSSTLDKSQISPLLPQAQIPEDLKKYLGTEWITQVLMRRYMNVVSQEYPQLFITSNIRRQACGYALEGEALHNVAKAIVPINQQVLEDFEKARSIPSKTVFAYPIRVSENHWTLLVIDKNTRTLEYYDSMGPYNQDYKAHFQKLASLLSEKEGTPPYQAEFKINKKLQFDTYHCGAWSLYFLYHRLHNKNIDFNNLPSTPNMGKYRHVIIDAIARAERAQEETLKKAKP